MLDFAEDGPHPRPPLRVGHPLSQVWERGPGGEGLLLTNLTLDIIENSVFHRKDAKAAKNFNIKLGVLSVLAVPKSLFPIESIVKLFTEAQRLCGRRCCTTTMIAQENQRRHPPKGGCQDVFFCAYGLRHGTRRPGSFWAIGQALSRRPGWALCFDTRARLDALGIIMLDLPHLGNQVGGVNEFPRRIAAGDHDFTFRAALADCAE